MILQPAVPPFLLLSTLFFYPPSALADQIPPFNCRFTVNDAAFDLNSVSGEHILNKTVETPPSRVVQSLRFNLCDNLKELEGIPQRDQCASGTRACLTQVNIKEEKDRIVSVIPLMQTATLELNFTSNLSSSPKFVSIVSKGPKYPNPIGSEPTTQILNVTLFCNPEQKSEPVFKSYDGTQVRVEWETAAGCPLNDDKKNDKTPDNTNPKGSGSGLSWFFLMFLLALAGYFGFGAYYNYSVYGARGADLIPHRDFWKEVPYMLSDVVSHLCSSVRPRRSSHGYISV